jgi:hypothetical protein
MKAEEQTDSFEQRSIGRETAIKLAESDWWKNMEPRAAFLFQMNTAELCMPFGEFHRIAELALGRSVWSHEFAFPKSLMAQFNGESAPPTVEEILNLIPEEKRIVLIADERSK